MATVPQGLLVSGTRQQVPLKRASVLARVSGFLVGLHSTLVYRNDGVGPLEVVFRFPVDESYAVVGLEAVVDGRRITASLREKEEARRVYDDAMAGGFTAALGEEQAGDIFSISLGNLPPSGEAELRLKLVGELPVDAGEEAIRFSLPSVLKPRYTPAGSSDPLAKIDVGGADDTVARALAPFHFSLEVAGGQGVSRVSSSTHVIETETANEGTIRVTLPDDAPLCKDLVLLIHQTDPHQPKAIAEPATCNPSTNAFMGSHAVMLSFYPKLQTGRAACEFIFLVDRSGSMSGEYIASTRETLALFLKSIPEGCHFNIVGFGSTFQYLFPTSVAYDQSRLDTAMEHVESLQADLGGTELLSPLRHVLGLPLLPGLPRQVFVLTDGSVSNTAACVQEAQRNANNARYADIIVRWLL